MGGGYSKLFHIRALGCKGLQRRLGKSSLGLAETFVLEIESGLVLIVTPQAERLKDFKRRSTIHKSTVDVIRLL